MKINRRSPVTAPNIGLAGGQILLLAAAMAAYWPGLSDFFLFDDFATINQLGSYGGVVNWETFKLFVLGHTSSPSGRPVSMLSFLLNDMAWPSEARSFKHTNLMLHLLNGMLLYTLIYKITPGINYSRAAASGLALLASGVWLLHPFNVSTVLYPVQRMAILAALFVLAGLVCYVYARTLLNSKPRTAYALMSLSITAGSALAFFSKENGALLPLMAWLLESFILSRGGGKPPGKKWQAIFLWLPGCLIVGLLCLPFFGPLASGYGSREYSLPERLLTEPRILFNYLYYWYIPQTGSPGLLTQNFPLSHGLLTPPSTLMAIIGIMTAIASALILRNRFPLYAFAVMFYFTGHLVESTTIPLEIYFEHRNYLPGAFLALPVAAMVVALIAGNRIWLFLSLIILTVPALTTTKLVSLWKNNETLAYHWARIHPDSQRAQRYAGLVAQDHGKWPLALSIISRARQRNPDNVTLHLHWLTLVCRFREISTAQKINTLNTLKNGIFSFRNSNLLESVTGFIASSQCRGGGIPFSIAILDALQANPLAKESPGAKHQLYHVRGIVLLLDSNPAKAAAQFRLSIMQSPQPASGLLQAGLLATAGAFTLALEHLEYVENNITLDKKQGDLDYAKEIRHMRAQLHHDIDSMP